MAEVSGAGFAPTMAQIAESIAPMLIDQNMPMGEASVPAPGSPVKAQGAGHRHERLTSTTVAVIAAGNTAEILFTRSFTNEPGTVYSALPATPDTVTPPPATLNVNAQPTSHEVVAWKKGPTNVLPDAPATAYTGCTVRVFRGQTLPQNLASLLLSGVYNLFAGGVVGTRFSIIAVARSDVAP